MGPKARKELIIAGPLLPKAAATPEGHARTPPPPKKRRTGPVFASKTAVEQALLAVIARPPQFVASDRKGVLDILALAHPHIVRASRVVAADQHRVGAHAAIGIELLARRRLALAIAADLELGAFA